MDLVRQVLPIGPDEWARVRSLYNERALTEGRAERQVKPCIFPSQIARTPKPTGRAEVPWWVEEAWMIENDINERAHVRSVDDDGIDGVGDDQANNHDVIEIFDSDEEDDRAIVKPDPDAIPRKKAKTAASSTRPNPTNHTPSTVAPPIAHTSAGSGPLASRPTRSGISNALMSNIAAAFDPEAQAARDDARASRNMETTMLQMLFHEVQTVQDRLAEQTRRAQNASRKSYVAVVTTGRRSRWVLPRPMVWAASEALLAAYKTRRCPHSVPLV